MATIAKSGKPSKILSRIALPLCLALFAVKAITSLVQESSTWDETFYFGLGKHLISTGRWDSFASNSHPPLSFYLSSISFLFISTHSKAWQDQSRDELGSQAYQWSEIEKEQALLSSEENRGNRLLDLSRIVMVCVALLLGFYVYRWARALYGERGGIAALLLFAFCPNMLAHARLITPDIVLTAFSFITMYYFWKLLKTGEIRDAIFCGIALGLALLSKFTGILLLPVCAALVIVYGLKRKALPWPGLAMVAGLAVATLFLGYQGHLENYWSGIQFQQIHASNGQWCFLGGDYSEKKGWWYFYPLAFLIKTPIALLILVIVALGIFCLQLWRRRGRLDELFLLLPAATVFVFFSANSLCLGLRYLLPVYPFLFVFAAGTVGFFLRRRVLKVALGILLAWYVGASFYIHPHYLAYFNELVGGPGEGYKWLVDSNLDWGQDLKGLGDYMRKHGIASVSLSYFGSDLPERYGIAYEWLPSFVLRNPDPGRKEIGLHDFVAISATNLQGLYFQSKDKFAFLRSRKPIAKIGYSIFIYDVRN